MVENSLYKVGYIEEKLPNSRGQSQRGGARWPSKIESSLYRRKTSKVERAVSEGGAR